MRKKRQISKSPVQQKELWPGAGLWLDWPKITGDDFAKVEQRLGEIKDTAEQILFLHRLQAEFTEAADNHLATCYETHYSFTGQRHTLVRGKPEEFIARKEQFDQRLQSKLTKLAKLRVIARAKDVLKSKTEGKDKPTVVDIAGKPTGDSKTTTAQRVMALYYLALAANDGQTITKAALGRLLEFLTGQKSGSTKVYWQNPKGKLGNDGKETKETKENQAVVRKVLEDMGLPRAIDLMDKDQR